MPRYLIIVPHRDDKSGCVKALSALDSYGSHFVTNAEFGCSDGTHTGWLLADLESRAQAQQIIPPEFRGDAKIVELQKFTREEIHRLMKEEEKE
ncbi:MAG TPA: hypothetical protein VNI57_13015 [Candidatus Saccharimonadales bacterium]|nr:hypothetical protein [Candidatus Saccharimonadales bacterium]